MENSEVAISIREIRHNADGSAVCPHRDLSVCADCASWEAMVEVAGVHYFVPDADERAELMDMLG